MIIKALEHYAQCGYEPDYRRFCNKLDSLTARVDELHEDIVSNERLPDADDAGELAYSIKVGDVCP